jgi:G:T-mismatch repair DNA endonuclease (very short patch repair protein)
MPRFFIRHERAPKDERDFRVYTPQWIDPYFWLVGSSIEKMVMAELARRGVFFIFRSQKNDLGGFVDPSWEADLLLPHHKIWIEVQGSYWHSQKGSIENDSLRYAAIEMAGWKPVFLWEFDIRERLHEKLDEIGVFYTVDYAKEKAARDRYGAADNVPFGLGDEELVDQLKGLRAALVGRTRPPQYTVRRQTRRRPK